MGTSLIELIQQVIDLTDRGENPAFVKLAVVKATLKAHLADFWMRDCQEVKLAPDITNGLQTQIFISSKMPGFRKLRYVRGYDDTTNPSDPSLMQNFDEVDPISIRDQYGFLHTNVYYAAGDVLTFYNNPIPPKYLIGFWGLPSVGEGTYKSWIADMFPSIIVDEASSIIFGSIGDIDGARRLANQFVPNLQLIRMQDVEVTGR